MRSRVGDTHMHVECAFLAEFKMLKLKERQEEHVGAAKIYRDRLGQWDNSNIMKYYV